ncbi:MAG: class I SAM-dependent methyltransferase [Polyangiales bacterium]
MRDAVRAGAEQVVILGAGLDARAWRLGLGVPFFEVDREHAGAQATTRAVGHASCRSISRATI